MSEENKALVRRWFREVWGENGSEATIPEMFHENGRAHGFPEPESIVTSPAAFAEHCRNFRKIFPDVRITIDDLVADGDRVAVRWTAKMTHTGDGLGFPGTSEPVRVVGSSFLICGNGKILEGWNYMDLTRMRSQLEHRAKALVAAR